MIEIIKLSLIETNKGQLEGLPKNPRFIKDEKFNKLVKSIEENPEMLELRELLVYPHDGRYVIIGGNMRYRAMQELGYKEAVCKVIPETATIEQLRAYTIKDNNGFGEFDFDLLANDWNFDELENWGVDLPNIDLSEETNPYTMNVNAPIYEITGEKPSILELVEDAKTNELIDKIQNSKVDNDIKEFLIKSAQRHLKFDYKKIAEYYANADKEVQELFEDSALVIIDFKSAIKNGFTKLSKRIEEMRDEE